MRLICNAERAFYGSLIREARGLTSARDLPTDEIMDGLQQMCSKQTSRLSKLREARNRAHEPERIRRLNRLIEIRKRAVSYLVDTGQWVIDRKLRAYSLRQRPRLLAVPTWSRRYEAPRAILEPIEYPFMEFSS